MSQIIMFIHTWSQTYTYDINLKASCCHDIHQFSKTTRQTYIHNTHIHTYIHTYTQPSNHYLVHIHTLMHRYSNINTKKNASSKGYSHVYIYTYIYKNIHKYIYIHIYIILYKCRCTRGVLTIFLISLSAPWLTRYSTISLCPQAAADIIAVSPF